MGWQRRGFDLRGGASRLGSARPVEGLVATDDHAKRALSDVIDVVLSHVGAVGCGARLCGAAKPRLCGEVTGVGEPFTRKSARYRGDLTIRRAGWPLMPPRRSVGRAGPR